MLSALRRARSPCLRGLLAFFLLLGASPASSADTPGDSPAGGSPSSMDPRASFERGLELFEAAQAFAAEHLTDPEEVSRRYREAAACFVRAWKAGVASTEVFTNAGNCFAFAGDEGRAVLFYRRALTVDPANKRARTALEHIRADLPVRKPASGAGQSILRTLFFWHDLAFSLRRTVFQILFPAAFACFVLAFWKRRPFRNLGFLLLACSLALLGSILIDAAGGSIRDEAVVITEVQGRLGDGRAYSPSHAQPFPPGTEVTVKQVRRRHPDSAGNTAGNSEAWLLVTLLNGQESWIPRGVVEYVVPAE